MALADAKEQHSHTTNKQIIDNASSIERCNLIGIDLGLIHDQVRDDILCPLRWDGFGLPLHLSYTYTGRVSRHEAEVHISFSFLSNRYDHPSLSPALFIGYAYLHEIINRNSFGQLYLGGLLDWSLSDYYYSWDEEHIYWMNAYALSPYVLWSRRYGKTQVLSAGFSIGILALTSRPPTQRYYKLGRLTEFGYWISKPHENMTITGIHEYLSCTINVHYTRYINRKILLGTSLLSNYRTHNKPEKFRSLINTLVLGIVFTPKPKGQKQ